MDRFRNLVDYITPAGAGSRGRGIHVEIIWKVGRISGTVIFVRPAPKSHVVLVHTEQDVIRLSQIWNTTRLQQKEKGKTISFPNQFPYLSSGFSIPPSPGWTTPPNP